MPYLLPLFSVLTTPPGPHYSPDPRLLPAHLVQAPALRPARLFLDDAAKARRTAHHREHST